MRATCCSHGPRCSWGAKQVPEEQRSFIDAVLHPDIASVVTGWQESMDLAGEEEFMVELDGRGCSLFVSARQTKLIENTLIPNEAGELQHDNPSYRIETPMWKISVERAE